MNPEKIDSVSSSVQKSFTLRGVIIHYITDIESLLSQMIIMHFCKEGAEDDFEYLLLSQKEFMIGLKKQLVLGICNLYYQDFIKDNPNFFKILHTKIELRNVFAHHQLSVSDLYKDDNDGTLCFQTKKAKTTDAKKVVYEIKNTLFTKRDIEIELEQMEGIITKLESLLTLMSNRKTG